MCTCMDISTCSYVCKLSRNETIINKAELFLFFEQIHADPRSVNFLFFTTGFTVNHRCPFRDILYIIRYNRNSIISIAI